MSFGQAASGPVRFRFDKESIRLRDVSAFHRWLETIPTSGIFDVEFEPSESEMHLLECPSMRQFASPLLTAIGQPFLRLEGDGLLALILASLSELTIIRSGETVTAVYPIDSLQSFFLTASYAIRDSPTAGMQLDRMLLASARLGMHKKDWLDPDSR